MTVYYAEAGDSIYTAVQRILGDPWKYFRGVSEVYLVFNEIKLRIQIHSHEYDIYEKYELLCRIRCLENTYQ